MIFDRSSSDPGSSLKHSRLIWQALLLVVVLAVDAGYAQPDDGSSTPQFEESMLVDATKYPVELERVPAPLTVIAREEIERSTARHLGELLARVSGIHVYDFSGDGRFPVADPRGFYSVGETSAMLLVIDGVPVNDLDTDEIDWQLIDLDQIERIEVQLGPVSALYGNVGMAGLVNVISRRRDQPGGGGGILLGSNSRRAAHGSATLLAPHQQLDLSLRIEEGDGWRDHSAWEAQRARVSWGLQKDDIGASEWGVSTRATAIYSDSERQDPGAVRITDEPELSRTPQDGTAAERLVIGWTTRFERESRDAWSLTARYEDKSQQKVRTVFFQSPLQVLDGQTIGLELNHQRSRGRWRWMAGFDLEQGTLDRGYRFAALSYRNQDRTERTTIGAYGWLERQLGAGWSISGNVRWDRLEAESTDRNVDSDARATSPTVAINYSWAPAQNAWLSYGKSFKAPTLEQWFDQRPFFLGGPDPVFLSNTALEPLRAKSIELGSRFRLARAVLAEAACYHQTVEDEIGFDAQRFAFANIAASVHDGCELSASTRLFDRLDLAVAYSRTVAEFDGGEFDGRQINGVPKQTASLRAHYQLGHGFDLALELDHRGRQYADEANTVWFGNDTVLHLRGTYRHGAWSGFASVRNLLDEEYFATGFMTPDTNFVFRPDFYPAARRTFELGIRWHR